MGHSLFSLQKASLGAIVFLSLSAAANASAVNTVFAAENALHGQGYDVGQADGWLDDDLRAAIKAFQGRNSGLLATGDLDAETLKTLGIDSEYAAVSRNALPNRRAAMAALGIDPRYHKPEVRTPKRSVVSTPEPTPTTEANEPPPKPEPQVPAPSVAATPEPKATTEVPTEAVKAPRASASASSAKTAVVEAPPTAPDSKPATTGESPKPKPATEQVASTPEPVASKPRDQTTRKSETADATEATVGEKADEVTVAKDIEADPAVTTQTTAMQEPDATPPENRGADSEASMESNEGFFSMLFHFLFGWMV